MNKQQGADKLFFFSPVFSGVRLRDTNFPQLPFPRSFPLFSSPPSLIRPNLLWQPTKLRGCSRTKTQGTRSTKVLKTLLSFLLYSYECILLGLIAPIVLLGTEQRALLRDEENRQIRRVKSPSVISLSLIIWRKGSPSHALTLGSRYRS